MLLWCVVYLCNFRRNEVGRGLKLKQLRAGDSVITVTSHWAPWRLESPASRWLAQPFIRAQIKETSKLRITGLCEGNSPVTGEFPSQMANNAANVSMTSSWFVPWRHHGSLRKIDPNCFVTGLRNANIMRLKYFLFIPRWKSFKKNILFASMHSAIQMSLKNRVAGCSDGRLFDKFCHSQLRQFQK